MIREIKSLSNVIDIFPEAWRDDVRKFWERNNNLFSPQTRTRIFALDKKAVNMTIEFDGVATSIFTWTIPSERRKGYSLELLKWVAEYHSPIPMMGRYHKDEKDIEKLLIKVGYEVIHRDSEGTVIVSYRTL